MRRNWSGSCKYPATVREVEARERHGQRHPVSLSDQREVLIPLRKQLIKFVHMEDWARIPQQHVVDHLG